MTKAAELAKMGEVLTNGQVSGRRNIIINGAMNVSQRNGTTDTTMGSGEVYALDRWKTFFSQASKMSVQQSTVVPTGFKNSTKITTQSAVSIGNDDYFGLCTDLEGQDVAHLSFGSASAKQVTLSFWVRSSLTGTFGVAIREQNNSPSRSFVTNYTISSADTWEYKTITVAGDTSGTWSTDNSAGLGLWFDLGTGSTYQGTLNTWEGANDATTSGTVSVVGTGSATWYITGVQLEVGSVATPFEHRSFGEEEELCKRYFVKHKATSPYDRIALGMATTTDDVSFLFKFYPALRTVPTLTTGTLSHLAVTTRTDGAAAIDSALTIDTNSDGTLSTIVKAPDINSDPLTAGEASYLIANNNVAAFVAFDAEL